MCVTLNPKSHRSSTPTIVVVRARRPRVARVRGRPSVVLARRSVKRPIGAHGERAREMSSALWARAAVTFANALGRGRGRALACEVHALARTGTRTANERTRTTTVDAGRRMTSNASNHAVLEDLVSGTRGRGGAGGGAGGWSAGGRATADGVGTRGARAMTTVIGLDPGSRIQMALAKIAMRDAMDALGVFEYEEDEDT